MVRTIDAEYLEELRARAAEVRADLEEREALAEDDHDAIMAKCRRVILKRFDSTGSGDPVLVHKVRADARVPTDTGVSDELSHLGQLEEIATDAPPFTDEQVDIISMALAMMRQEYKGIAEAAVAPLRERVATLEGSIDMLMTLLSDTNKMRLLR
jgi:hypothetical protein